MRHMYALECFHFLFTYAGGTIIILLILPPPPFIIDYTNVLGQRGGGERGVPISDANLKVCGTLLKAKEPILIEENMIKPF